MPPAKTKSKTASTASKASQPSDIERPAAAVPVAAADGRPSGECAELAHEPAARVEEPTPLASGTEPPTEAPVEVCEKPEPLVEEQTNTATAVVVEVARDSQAGNASKVCEPLVPASAPSYDASRWELFLAGEKVCPLCGFLTFFALGWLFLIVFLVKIRQEGMDIFSFDSSDVKSNLVVQNSYAFAAATGQTQGCADDAHNANKEACEADEACAWDPSAPRGRFGKAGKQCKEKQLCPGPPPKDRESPLVYDSGVAFVAMIYEARDGGNIFDDDILEHIRKFEAELLTSVKGASLSDGTPSPWDKDWCLMTYPSVGSASSAGRCASPTSVVNFFAMTAEGRSAAKAEAEAGFAFAGGASKCLCTDSDALCGICTADGGLKGYNATTGDVDFSAWPPSIAACIASQASGPSTTSAPPATGTTGSSNGTAGDSAACQARSASASGSSPGHRFASFCQSRPSCQWAPPRASAMCSATSFYHPLHVKGLVAGADKQQALSKLCDEANTAWWSLRKDLLPRSLNCGAPDKRSSFGRTTFFAGGSGDASEDGRFEEGYIQGKGGWYAKESELERDVEAASNGKLRVILFSSATVRSQMLSILLVDSLLSIGSLILVWAYMWWSLESAFLASVAMFEIVFSLPVSLVVWTVVFQQRISWFQLLCIYMILGIGADDAFILHDAWLQARLAGEEIMSHWTRRFAFAYRRAFLAMFITTATTCGSFIIGAISPLPQVQAFCIFAAMVVFVDWLFCITLFASALVVHDRYLKGSRDPGECLGPGCCCGLMRFLGQKWCKKWVGDLPKADSPAEKRGLEKFCEKQLFGWLKTARFALIAGWFAVIVAMLVTAGVALRTAEKAAPIGRESLDAIRGIQILLDEFSIFDVPTTSFVYGLDPEKPVEFGSGSDPNKAVYNSGEAARVATREGQLELLKLCRAADMGQAYKATRCQTQECLILGGSNGGLCPRKDRVYRSTGVYMTDDPLCLTGRYCFMEDFARYWAFHIRGAPCRTPQNSTSCAATTGCAWDADRSLCTSGAEEEDYDGLDPDEFIRHLSSESYTQYSQGRLTALRAEGRGYEATQSQSLTGIRLNAQKTAVELAWVSFNATFPTKNSVDEANEWYNRWEAFRLEHAPKIGGFQTADLYKFMVTQNEMVKAAVMGVLLSLVIAGIVLVLATLNWWVALVGLLNIAGITCVFMGVIPLAGWSLGENECIFLIAVVGLSVDYTVHLLHVYNHADAEDRMGRAKHALAEMGISVLNSALTTLLAATLLFACGFYFFMQFGGFIFAVISLSIVMSITFLMPLLMVIGPEGTQGSLRRLRYLFLKPFDKERGRDRDSPLKPIDKE